MAVAKRAKEILQTQEPAPEDAFKNRTFDSLTKEEKADLLRLVAERLGLIKPNDT